jgi:septal ring-binding cell division protein DamX
MAPEQDWCLECGTAVTTRVVPPPSWGLPVAVGLGALALLAAVVVVTLNLLSDDAKQAASNSAKPAVAVAPTRTTATAQRQATQPQPTTPAAAPTATTPATTTTETVPGAAEAKGGGPVPLWPASKNAYTLVVDSTSNRAAAEKRARELIAGGQDAGILRSDGYDFFSPGAWIVWAGQYPDRPAAEKAAPKVQRKAPSAYVTLIRKRGGP